MAWYWKVALVFAGIIGTIVAAIVFENLREGEPDGD